MVKEAVADKHGVQAHGDRFLARKKPNATQDGIIIGVATPQKYVLLDLVPLPPSPVGADGEGDEYAWPAEHARQVSRSLPAGLCVLGIFDFRAEKDHAASLGKLSSRLRACAEAAAEGDPTGVSEAAMPRRAVLHLCPVSKKYTLRDAELGSTAKGSGVPLSFKDQAAAGNVSLVRSVFCAIPSASSLRAACFANKTARVHAEDAGAWIRGAVAAAADGSIAILGNAPAPEGTPVGKMLDSKVSGPQGKGRLSVHNVTLLAPLRAADGPGADNAGGVAALRGAVACIGAVPAKADCSEIARVLARAAAKSAADRIAILADESDDGDLPQPLAGSAWAPPSAVLVWTADSVWPRIEYRSAGEDDAAIVERLHGIGLVPGDLSATEIVDVESPSSAAASSGSSSAGGGAREAGSRSAAPTKVTEVGPSDPAPSSSPAAKENVQGGAVASSGNGKGAILAVIAVLVVVLAILLNQVVA